MRVYAKSVDGPLRQGEILSGLTQYVLNLERLRAGEYVLDPIKHPYAIVLAQDCDLDQNHNSGLTDDLASVLLCAVDIADTVRTVSRLGSKEWKYVTQNTYPRFHYVRPLAAEDDAIGEGLPALAIDFKTHFTLPVGEAYHQLETAKRRARLDSPYAEHLSQRFSSYLSRVALPLDHHRDLPPPAPLALPAAPIHAPVVASPQPVIVVASEKNDLAISASSVQNAKEVGTSADSNPTAPLTGLPSDDQL